MSTTATPSRRRATQRRGSSGWLPNQHGAWAMLVVPWLLGFVAVVRAEGPVVSSLVMFFAWVIGYFAFFAMSQWLRSRMKPRYRPAVLAYSGTAGILGLWLLVLRPEWLSWAVVFAPLVALSLWLAWRRRDRSLLSGASTVVAASLLPMVMNSDGLWPWTVPSAVVIVSLTCFGYFFGTVLYVKTIIRQRGRQSWVLGSVAWHLLCVAASFVLLDGMARGLVTVFFLLMTARAWLVPWMGPLRGHNFSAKSVGIGEFASTAMLLLVSLAA